METFKKVAIEILKEAGKPLHVNEITKLAQKRKWLKTTGKTPAATMWAQLVVDYNKNQENSIFIKKGPGIFGLNPKYFGKNIANIPKEPKYKISHGLSTKQKGDIVEARIAELITLYGINLSCYKPISDDEGIDLIVKEKGDFKAVFLQVKSNFNNDSKRPFVASVKRKHVVDKSCLGFVFCLFDISLGDISQYLWLVPAPDFIKMAHKDKNGLLGFVSGKLKKDTNKWDEFMIDKKDLAAKISEQLKRI